MVEFGVLGPLEVFREDEPLSLGGHQQQLVLAVLLTNLNRVVSTDRLIDEIWGESPTRAARKTVQSHAAHLRSLVNRDGEILRGRPPGYLLEMEPDQVDAHRFEALVHEGRSRLASDPAAAAQILRQALGLWRGPPYDDLADDAPSLREEAARLEELHLAAQEARFEADLRSGEDISLVSDLERAVAAHPYRERLRSLLMLVLYRAGRQTDALGVYQEARRVLAEDLGLEPSPELQRLEQAVLDHDPMLRSADPLGALVSPAGAIPHRNPYKGLRPFTEDDTEDFFGRADLVRRLTERLGRRDVTGRLVVVAGPSGSGKSSVVRAGLIPDLRQGAVSGSEDWRVETLYPGQDPLGALRKALGGRAGGEVEEEDFFDLPAAVEEPTLLVIDQFEEIFTLTEDDRTRRTFLDWIASATAHGGSGLRVVVTIRADILDRLLQYPELARLLQPCLELVPPLAEHEVRAAVTEPAARVGVRADPELVAEMTRDAAARPGALPLLQYALTDLFERRTGDGLTVDAYRAAGEISGALARRAEDLYRGLDDSGREAIRQGFLRLVVLTDEGEHLRRRMVTAELAQLPLDRSDLDGVLEIFGQHRLLTFDRDPETGEATVEIAHEALLREWPRLREWIEEAREGLLLQRRLASALAEWRDAGEDTSYLVGGGRLEQFETWLTGTDLALTQDEHEFIAASRRYEDRRRRQQNMRRWSLVAVLTLAVLLVSGLALFIRGRERTATARELAAASATLVDTDPQLSLLLALEAVRADENAREAVEALHRAATQSRELWRATWEADRPLAQAVGVQISPDDSLVAMTGDGATVVLLDRESGELVRTLEPEAPVDLAVNRGGPGVSFSPDGRQLAAFGPDGVVRIWEVQTGTLVVRLIAAEGNLEFARSVVFGPNGRWLYTSAAGESPDLPVIQWSTDTWAVERRWESGGVVGGGVVVSHDGTLLAVPFLERREVLVFDTETGAEVTRIEIAGDNEIVGASFNPHGPLAVAAGGHITVWDPRTGEQLPVEFAAGVLANAIALEFDPSGDRLATGLLNEGVLSVWETRPFEEVTRALRLAGHTGTVGGIDFDSSGDTLVSGSGDRTVRLWNTSLTGRGEVTSIGSRFPIDIRFFDEGRRLAVVTHGDFHGMQLVDLASGEQTRIPEAYSGRVAFTDDESRFAAQIAAIDEEGRQDRVDPFEPAIGVWDTETGDLLQEIHAPGEACRIWAPGFYPAFSRDGRVLAVGYQCEKTLRVWELSPQQLIAELEHDFEVAGAVFTPDDRHVVTVALDGVVRLWDSATWTLAREIRSGDEALVDVGISPDGSLAAASDTDGTVYLWSTQDWSLLRTLTGHAGAVNRVVFGPEGKRLATAGNDATVRIWDVETGEELWNLQGHDHAVESVAFHPDGNHIASMSATNWAIWIWTLDTDELIEIAETRVTRPLTDRECRIYLHLEACPAE